MSEPHIFHSFPSTFVMEVCFRNSNFEKWVDFFEKLKNGNSVVQCGLFSNNDIVAFKQNRIHDVEYLLSENYKKYFLS